MLTYFLLIYVPIAVFFTQYIFQNILNLPPKASTVASNLCIYMTFSIFFHIQYFCINSYLQAMNKIDPGMYITLITLVFYPLILYFFALYLDYKEIGIAIASCILNLSNYIIIEIYNIKYNPYPSSLIGPSNYIFIEKEKIVNSFSSKYDKNKYNNDSNYNDDVNAKLSKKYNELYPKIKDIEITLEEKTHHLYFENKKDMDEFIDKLEKNGYVKYYIVTNKIFYYCKLAFWKKVSIKE